MISGKRIRSTLGGKRNGKGCFLPSHILLKLARTPTLAFTPSHSHSPAQLNSPHPHQTKQNSSSLKMTRSFLPKNKKTSPLARAPAAVAQPVVVSQPTKKKFSIKENLLNNIKKLLCPKKSSSSASPVFRVPPLAPGERLLPTVVGPASDPFALHPKISLSSSVVSEMTQTTSQHHLKRHSVFDSAVHLVPGRLPRPELSPASSFSTLNSNSDSLQTLEQEIPHRSDSDKIESTAGFSEHRRQGSF